MKLKSFFADTVEQAIRLARREMGPDAMLVHSKRTSTEAQHLGNYEVVCAAAPDAAPQPDSAVSIPARLPAAPFEKLIQDVSSLRQQMERLARSLAHCGTGMAGIGSDPELASAFATLTYAELDTDLAYEVIARISSPLRPGAVRRELNLLVNVNAEVGCQDAPARIAVLIGPPGSGKTSALIKLAVACGISARKRTQLLTLDTYRVAAADELQSYAAILGIGCQVVETADALPAALNEHRNKDLILIDTPGLSGSEMEGFEDLASFLARAPGLDKHLVLPASMRAADLKRVAEQYAAFKPDKLLFTRLDETETLGPMLSLSARMRIPISFLSRGQRIPEDLEAAGADALLDSILKSEPVEEPGFGVAAA